MVRLLRSSLTCCASVMRPRISFHLITILLIWIHDFDHPNSDAVVHRIFDTSCHVEYDLKRPKSNEESEKVNIAETPESHATEDVAFAWPNISGDPSDSVDLPYHTVGIDLRDVLNLEHLRNWALGISRMEGALV